MKTYKEFLEEKVLSIGLNDDHEKYREKHRAEIHQMLHHSYKEIGGYGGSKSGSKEESDKIHDDISHSIIKATKRKGKISSVALYAKKHGRKAIGAATDGSNQGKMDYKKNKLEDHEQKRAWGEVSGAPEHIARKLGVPVVPNHRAEKLTGKKVTPDSDGEHYTRKIGDHEHRKVIVGHPKED